MAHPALLSRGGIEFVYAKKDTYPLVYLRSSDDERILVILNPSAHEAAFPCEFSPKECIYSFGGELHAAGTTLNVPAYFAGFYRV